MHRHRREKLLPSRSRPRPQPRPLAEALEGRTLLSVSDLHFIYAISSDTFAERQVGQPAVGTRSLNGTLGAMGTGLGSYYAGGTAVAVMDPVSAGGPATARIQFTGGYFNDSNSRIIYTVTEPANVPANITGVLSDIGNKRVYWLDATSPGAVKTLNRIKVDGTDVQTLLTLPATASPYSLALDPIHGRIYWSDAASATINSINLDGGEFRTDYQAPASAGVSTIRSIAFDQDNGKLYAAEGHGASFKVITLDRDGSNPHDLFTTGWTDPKTLVLDLHDGVGFAGDSGNIVQFNLDETGAPSAILSGLGGSMDVSYYTMEQLEYLFPSNPPDQATIAGTSTNFDLGAIDALGPHVSTIAVDWGDGSTERVSPTSSLPSYELYCFPATPHTYANAGTYTARITVQMGPHPFNDPPVVPPTPVEFRVKVSQPLSVAAPPDQFGVTQAASPFHFGTLSTSNAAGPYTLSINWGDGSVTTAPVTTAGTLPVVSHAYAADGNYTITQTVSDLAGDVSAPVSFKATVQPAGLLSLSNPADQPASVGLATSFDLGTLSADPLTTGPFNVTVNWGDGSAATVIALTAAGAIPATAHTYASAGRYSVTASAADSAGNTSQPVLFTATAQGSASIVLSPPTVAPEVYGDNPTVFSLGRISVANDINPLHAVVDWGDGSANSTIQIVDPTVPIAGSHVYAALGHYTVHVTVSDSAGTTSNTIAVTAIAHQWPKIVFVGSAGPDQAAAPGVLTTFSLGASVFANTDAPYTTDVDWGDGTPHTTYTKGTIDIETAAHSYANVGRYHVKVTVSETREGASGYSNFDILISPASLVITPPAAQSPIVGRATSFSLGSLAATNGKAPYSLKVNWGDGSAVSTIAVSAPGTLPAATHTYATVGNYTVSLTASDSAGHSSSAVATFSANVKAAPVTTLTLTAPAAQTAVAGTPIAMKLGTLAATNGVAPYKVTVNWGDGSAATVVSMTAAGTIPATNHTYAKAGTFTATVSAADSASHTAKAVTFVTTVKTATLTLTAPAAQSTVATKPTVVKIGTLASTNASPAYKATITWGDGTATTFVSTNLTGVLPAPTHTFAKTGKFTVSVSVVDAYGHASNKISFVETVAAPASIAGTVFNDVNADGIINNGEVGIGNWRVYIDTDNNSAYDSTKDVGVLTDINGKYTFSLLSAGTYNVRIVPVPGDVPTKPSTNLLKITLIAGQVSTGNLFGEKAK